MAIARQWPTARDFSEALQTPSIAFASPHLKSLSPALDRFGMPVIATGNFAAVCKLSKDDDSFGIRFFTRDPGDREQRYRLIDSYLSKHNIPAVADFIYRPNEILIAGGRFPIIQMEWIQGMRLDLYVEAALKSTSAIGALAESWLRIISDLEDRKIAHGDLQHGNILVDSSGNLRLVDLDGMCVPGMESMQACEEGHRAYQHPDRRNCPFDLRLDRFPSLVIYLSLVALEQSPTLWTRFHDDNLIFRRDDFLDPRSSPLIKELASDRGEVGKLTKLLLEALAGSAAACPSILSSRRATSRLPNWMHSGIGIVVPTKTREVSTASLQNSHGLREIGSTPTAPRPSSSPLQPVTSAPSGTSPQAIPQPPIAIRWSDVLSTGIGAGLFMAFALTFLGVPFALHALLTGIGLLPKRDSGWITAGIYVACCVAYSISSAYDGARARATSRNAVPGASGNTPAPTTPSYPSATGRYPYGNTRPSSGGTTSGQVVASRIRAKYHRPSCRWARKISYSNRITFSSASEAIRAGRRACTECNP